MHIETGSLSSVMEGTHIAKAVDNALGYDARRKRTNKIANALGVKRSGAKTAISVVTGLPQQIAHAVGVGVGGVIDGASRMVKPENAKEKKMSLGGRFNVGGKESDMATIDDNYKTWKGLHDQRKKYYSGKGFYDSHKGYLFD